jgi:hypothetical protein
MGNRKGSYSVLVEKPEKKRLLGRPTCKLEYNITMDFQGVV